MTPTLRSVVVTFGASAALLDQICAGPTLAADALRAASALAHPTGTAGSVEDAASTGQMRLLD